MANKYGFKCDMCETHKKINKHPEKDRPFTVLCPKCFEKFKKEANAK